MNQVVDIQCIDCRKEFLSSDLGQVMCCPACGSHSVPLDPRTRQKVVLTRSEWNTLLTLARHYGASLNSQGGEYLIDTIASLIDDKGIAAAITPHEIRVLTIWGTNALMALPGSRDQEHELILSKLRAQLPKGTCLTMEDEFANLRKLHPDLHIAVIEPSKE